MHSLVQDTKFPSFPIFFWIVFKIKGNTLFYLKVINVNIIHKKLQKPKSPLLTASKFISFFPTMQEDVHRIYLLARVCSCSFLFVFTSPINFIKLRNLYKLYTNLYINNILTTQFKRKTKYQITYLIIWFKQISYQIFLFPLFYEYLITIIT